MLPLRLFDTIPDHFKWMEYGKVIMATICRLKFHVFGQQPGQAYDIQLQNANLTVSMIVMGDRDLLFPVTLFSCDTRNKA